MRVEQSFCPHALCAALRSGNEEPSPFSFMALDPAVCSGCQNSLACVRPVFPPSLSCHRARLCTTRFDAALCNNGLLNVVGVRGYGSCYTSYFHVLGSLERRSPCGGICWRVRLDVVQQLQETSGSYYGQVSNARHSATNHSRRKYLPSYEERKDRMSSIDNDESVFWKCLDMFSTSRFTLTSVDGAERQ
ncbi:hypothetical protein EJ04DRAFT_589768 [Polyplosphaeria fusca]|uniref:Uncharacterized protein n=1 Tax=Polyplosphaeria fusca TaxID=682080 RepID=A0A9P4R2K2_9PLEO|nr:hypothetical protein EJ04DRAFT_589768 [Polyplosphaeria fusca]